jgi:hypothetical protein
MSFPEMNYVQDMLTREQAWAARLFRRGIVMTGVTKIADKFKGMETLYLIAVNNKWRYFASKSPL